MGSPRRQGLPPKDASLTVLLRAAQADGELRALFRELESLPVAQRDTLLDRLSMDAQRRDAPSAFREALDTLRDPRVLAKLRQLL